MLPDYTLFITFCKHETFTYDETINIFQSSIIKMVLTIGFIIVHRILLGLTLENRPF